MFRSRGSTRFLSATLKRQMLRAWFTKFTHRRAKRKSRRIKMGALLHRFNRRTHGSRSELFSLARAIPGMWKYATPGQENVHSKVNRMREFMQTPRSAFREA